MSLTIKEREWIQGEFDKLSAEVVKVQIGQAVLKVKSGIWGLVGGCIPVVILIGIYIIIRG
jgi:hypothetical protein